MTEVFANNLRFHVQRLSNSEPGAADDRPTVVFLHGLVVDNLSSLYLTLATTTADLGAHTICYDQRGHGRSERPATGYTLNDSVADLNALIEALDVRGPVHLVGNSYGGLLALAYAAEHPDRAAGLLLIESVVPSEGWGDRIVDTLSIARTGAYDDRLRHLKGRKWDNLTKQFLGLFHETSLLADMAAERPFTPERFAAVEAPVHALFGSESDLLPDASLLQKHLPHFELTVLEGQSHMMLTQASGQVREQLRTWLS
ncbi:alpha/beta fold hydrolase [Allokutzneria albata]|uniref:Pimeloyl-ACP methyl ester carboxylesterase n=1 Tax=Allokutzneria albata TaxID=211114 RepID=A0A1G9Y0I0_ALLAB|nr:alpha/beta hydrolase [Allokutzneria albata]SDN01923.1 Pimeloyl-ACP methyl ester carboxylesterase [Allokutzneria albata]